MRSLAEALKEVPDHRSRLGRRHELSALLVFMGTGMLCSCRSLQALTNWDKRQEGALVRAMGFPRGCAPGDGTLQRLVSGLNVDALERVWFGWAQELLKIRCDRRTGQGWRWMVRSCGTVGRTRCPASIA
jgi:hypothetical protein